MVYFWICVENLWYYCCFLSGFSVKFSHQNFTDNMWYIWGYCDRQIMEIRNPSHIFWSVLWESLGLISRLLSFQYTSIICLKKTHLHEDLILQWVAKVLACSTYFFLTPQSPFWMLLRKVTNLRQYFWGWWSLQVTLISKDESQDFCLLCWLEGCHPPTFGIYCTV